jgi:hypothetical protein
MEEEILLEDRNLNKWGQQEPSAQKLSAHEQPPFGIY